MKYSEEKATALACLFLERAGGELEDLKLMKLMYIAERRAIELRNVGISGDRFFSMRNGPVLSETLNRMTPRDQDDRAGIWREYVELPSGWMLRLKKPFDAAKALSKRELNVVEDIWNEFGKKTKWELVELTHAFREWHDPGESSSPISFQEILVGLRLPPDQVRSRYAEYRALQE